MKIAFIGCRDIHNLGGIEAYMYNLCTELVKMGHEPIVYCESNKDEEEIVNGFRVIHQKSLKNPAFSKIWLAPKSARKAIFKEKGVDVIHFNGASTATFAVIWPKLFGRLYVMQCHGFQFERTKYSVLEQKILKFKFGLDCRWNKHLTAVSQEQSDYIKKHYHKDCRTIKCAVNMPGRVEESDVLERFGIRPNNYILFMGRLVQDKNPDYLIRGFMASNHGEKQLVLCGTATLGSKYGEHLKELAKNCPNVIFTGAIFGADKDVIYRNAWVYCLPSTLEGLPISLLEGMSYGKVCIASDIPANHEALGDESGIWVEKENDKAITETLNNLYKHYEDYEWQGKANHERCAKEFTWQKTAKEYVDYIEELVNKTE